MEDRHGAASDVPRTRVKTNAAFAFRGAGAAGLS